MSSGKRSFSNISSNYFGSPFSPPLKPSPSANQSQSQKKNTDDKNQGDFTIFFSSSNQSKNQSGYAINNGCDPNALSLSNQTPSFIEYLLKSFDISSNELTCASATIASRNIKRKKKNSSGSRMDTSSLPASLQNSSYPLSPPLLSYSSYSTFSISQLNSCTLPAIDSDQNVLTSNNNNNLLERRKFASQNFEDWALRLTHVIQQKSVCS